MAETEVTVSMPLQLTHEMMCAVRDNPLTAIEDREEWFTRLGWLICAYDVLLKVRQGQITGAPNE